MKLYTKTGDSGTSSLYNGERRPKGDLVFQVLGDVDELSAVIGLACEEGKEGPAAALVPLLHNVQFRLVELGSHVATPGSTDPDSKAQFDTTGTQVAALEATIDALDAELPPLTNFILPSGGLCSATLHVARTTCRRAERGLAVMHEAGSCGDAALKYLNRLSDFLFCAARWAAMRLGADETTFQANRGPMTYSLAAARTAGGGTGGAAGGGQQNRLWLQAVLATGCVLAVLWARR